jgi:hypothetical protein
MKWIFLFCLLNAVHGAQAQTVTVMAEQLVELKLLEHSTTIGYRIMSAGVDSIGNIQGREYRMHQTYFHSLDVINPALYANSSIKQNENILSVARATGGPRATRAGAVDRRSVVTAGSGQGETYFLKEHVAGNVPGLYHAGTRLYKYPGY